MDAIKTRRSIRRYKPTPVPEEILKAVLNAARLAPSASNAQRWRIIVVTDEDAKLRLVASANGQKFLAQAPIVLVACALPYEDSPASGGYTCSHVIDASIALDHVTLTAHSMGLGTCWVGWFREDKIRDVLGIPEDVRVVAVTPLGYPDETPERPPRRNLEELVLRERYQ